MWYQFLRGLAMGPGPVLVLLLANIDLIPIIGGWAAQIANQIGHR